MKPRAEHYDSGAEMRGRYRQIRKRLSAPPAVAAAAPAPIEEVHTDIIRRPLFTAPIEEVSEIFTIEEIIKITCREFGITRAQFLTRRRSKPAVLRRFIAIGLCLRFVKHASLPRIGSHFELDHTTVLHAARRIMPTVDAIANDLPNAAIGELVHALRRCVEDEGWLGHQNWDGIYQRPPRAGTRRPPGGDHGAGG